MTKEQKTFRDEMMEVSGSLAAWVQEQFKNDWSLEDVKLALRNAMKVVEKERA